LIVPGVAGRIAADRQAPIDAGFADGLGLDVPPERWRQIGRRGVVAGAVDGWVLSDGDVYCAIAGNIDWLDYELADVQLRRGPAHALLQAYRRHRGDLLAQIGGRFSLFLWDHANNSGIVACDRFCQVPVYWGRTGVGDLVFGPTTRTVNALIGKPLQVAAQGIFNYLYFHMTPGPGTVFEGVNKLMAAHALIATDGYWQTRRYWDPDFREHADGPLDEDAGEMLGLLSSSVARLAKGADTGAFLSGGLDSSTVAGLLARHHPRPKTYSIGFNARGYDEIAYARLASERFNTDFKTYYVTPDDVLEQLPKIAAAYDEPFGNSSALPAFFCARFAAADGRQRLLAGDGGDELFAGNERYAKQAVFERYGQIPGWARRHFVEPVCFRLLPGNLRVVAKARSYIQQANVALPERLQTYNFLNQFGARRIVSDELWNAVDSGEPSRLERDLYEHPRSAGRLNRMLYLDWHHTLADNDLRKVNRMCQLAGIEVEYPMLDDRLVEFSTRVSSTRKMRGNRLRDFYKGAVSGLLPEQIINKPKHGFGLPFGVWLAEHPGLQELAAENLLRMKRRGYVRPEFVDEIVRLHREQHAGYYGEFIWVMTMLELWLTNHGMEP
jgi:asparagine synthase (glutamine-hydrolysing)